MYEDKFTDYLRKELDRSVYNHEYQVMYTLENIRDKYRDMKREGVI